MRVDENRPQRVNDIAWNKIVCFNNYISNFHGAFEVYLSNEYLNHVIISVFRLTSKTSA